MADIFDLENVLKGFNDDQLRLFFSNTGAIEITDGCSIGCHFCGFEAKKGVRGVASFSSIESIAKRFSKELKQSKPILYFASDPLDWEEDGRDYSDINDLFSDVAGYKPYISTAVPKGKENLMLELLLKGKLDRVSISVMNYNRLRSFLYERFPELGSKSFEVEINEDTNERKVIFKEGKHSETDWQDLILKLTLDRPYLLSKDGISNTDSVQKLGKKNIGNLSNMAISCMHGGLIRRNGIYNIRAIKPTNNHPQGNVYEKLSPTNFKVWDYWHNPNIFVYSYLPEKDTQIAADLKINEDFLKPIPAQKERHPLTKLMQAYLVSLTYIHAFFEQDLMFSDKTGLYMSLDLYHREFKKGLDGKTLPEDNPYTQRIKMIKRQLIELDKEKRHWLYSGKSNNPDF